MRRYAPHRGQPVERAQTWIGRGYQRGWCLRWALFEVLGVAPSAPDAATYWTEALERGKVTRSRSPRRSDVIPAGALVLWTGGAHGHAAIADGQGNVVTTDLPVRSRVGVVPIEQIHDQWGYELVGYVEVDGAGWILA